MAVLTVTRPRCPQAAAPPRAISLRGIIKRDAHLEPVEGLPTGKTFALLGPNGGGPDPEPVERPRWFEKIALPLMAEGSPPRGEGPGVGSPPLFEFPPTP